MDITQNQYIVNGLQNWLADYWIELLTILIGALLAYFVGTRLVTIAIRRIVKGGKHREWHKKDIEKRQKTLVDLFINIWRMLIFFTVLYALAKLFVPNISETLAPLFASAGIIGIALGFGAQSLIKDFLSGIFIISENQYRVGDVVEIEGFSGTVERIGSRSTVLRDVEGQVHYFPNGMVQHVINKTMGYSMARFTVAVHPDANIDTVSDIIDTLGLALSEEEAWKDKILKAPSFVSIGEITGSSVEVIVAGKTQPSDQWSVVAEMRKRLLEEFETKGIKLATVPVQAGTPGRKRR
ncbi:MAG TPA: mechanosensitive ion channel family protein [Candidatus Saccharibacteria bacterium]|nr:mechanosensitive ion channel family protein [Candidatus Saccharibacteria bacterium]